MYAIVEIYEHVTTFVSYDTVVPYIYLRTTLPVCSVPSMSHAQYLMKVTHILNMYIWRSRKSLY